MKFHSRLVESKFESTLKLANALAKELHGDRPTAGPSSSTVVTYLVGGPKGTSPDVVEKAVLHLGGRETDRHHGYSKKGPTPEVFAHFAFDGGMEVVVTAWAEGGSTAKVTGPRPGKAKSYSGAMGGYD